MPKFLYTVVFIAAGLWGVFLLLLNKTAPNTFWNIFLFLGVLFVAVGLTLSIPLYTYLHKKAPTFTNLRFLYRKGLKWGLFISFGVVGTLGLKAFDLINPLNYGLFLVLYGVLFSQFKSGR